MVELVRIPRRTLLQFVGLIHQRTYTNTNPLVRWIFWKRLAGLLELSKGVRRTRALDFGCAEGVLLPSLSRGFEQVVAVDLDVGAAAAVAGFYRLENTLLVQARSPELPFADGAFDFIVAADVLEHFLDLGPAAAELDRVLAPGGRLVVSAPSENIFYTIGRKVFGFTKPEDHYHRPEDIENALRQHLELETRRYLPVHILQETSAFVLLALSKRARAV